MAGYNAFGVQFQRGDGEPSESFDTIGEATNIDGPGMQRDTIDVTSHDSLDGYREHIGGLKDGGEISFEVNYDPDIHNILQDDLDDPQPRNYRLVYPDPPGGGDQFSAIFTNMSKSFPMDGKMSANFSFKINGKPVPLDES